MTATELASRTKLKARVVEPLSGDETDTVGHRYQLGKYIQETVNVTDHSGRKFTLNERFFVLHYFGKSWDDVGEKVSNGERAEL